MKRIGKKYQWALLIPVIVAGLACGSVGPRTDEGDLAADESIGYEGIALERAGSYEAHFEARFAPQDVDVTSWVYELDVIADGSEDVRVRRVHIEGVSGAHNPGDISLLESGIRQYMSGPGVQAGFEGAPCLIAPRDIVIEESFLTPDDFLQPDDLSGVLVADGEEEIGGVTGDRFPLDNVDVGDFHVDNGQIVIAQDEGYVLSMDVTGSLIDPYFTDSPGTLTIEYRVSALGATADFRVPADCAIPYPVLADAIELSWFGDVLGYQTLLTPDDVIAYYQSELAGQGWEVLAIPREENGATVLTYARQGVVLTVSVARQDEMTTVNMVVER